jgi:hypothetical protein
MLKGCARSGIIAAVSLFAVVTAVAQRQPDPSQAQSADYQAKLQQVIDNKAAYATGIVQKWDSAARESGKWNSNYATDLFNALMKLQPENLLAVGQASTYQQMTTILAKGPMPTGIAPNYLGDVSDDMVYTPVAPCRIVDTRFGGGMLGYAEQRDFDADGSSFAGQGGYNGSCGIPFGVAQAVAMNITVTQPAGGGYFTAWRYLSSRPTASILNYVPGETVANMVVVPIYPGSGPDWSLYTSSAAHAVVDVMGYFAAPQATALDCITVNSPSTSIPVNLWYRVDATCPAGRTATGGGYDVPTLGTLAYPNLWVTSLPMIVGSANGWSAWFDNQTGGNRDVTVYARCCRIPGR